MSFSSLQELSEAIDVFCQHNTINKKNFLKLRKTLSSYIGNDRKKHIRFSSEHYTRYKIRENDQAELILIGRDCLQKSDIHDHAEHGCLLTVLQGELEERHFDKQGKQFIRKNTFHHRIGGISYMHDSIGYHSIFNPSSQTACATLHLYAPANHTTHYRKDPNTTSF